MSVINILFCIFACLSLLGALFVIFSKNPVQSILWLVFVFVMMACLWLMMQAEFLGLILILVYVGAVMTLFLFVVMMLNLSVLPKRASIATALPLGLLVVLGIAGLLAYVFYCSGLQSLPFLQANTPVSVGSNAKALGAVLYTNFAYPFELSGIILLIAMIAAISLAFHAFSGETKKQNIAKQVDVKASDRLTLLKDLPSGKKTS
jgi:NADH-quinone oxidoreductase subunit J